MSGAEICTDNLAPAGFPSNACDGGAGTYALPKAVFDDPISPNGHPDQSGPTPDEDLISFAIE